MITMIWVTNGTVRLYRFFGKITKSFIFVLSSARPPVCGALIHYGENQRLVEESNPRRSGKILDVMRFGKIS